MAEKIAIKQLQSLEESSAFINLFELEYNDAGDKKYFVRSGEADNSTLHFRDYDSPGTIREYEILPISIEDLQHTSTGPSTRPILRVANVLNTFETAVGVNLDNLLGKKLIRRRTLKKYLDNGSGNSSNPATEFPRQVYIIDRIETRNALEVAFELTTPFEVEGLTLPYRQVGHNACSWIYQGASPSKSIANQIGGCTWHSQGKYNLNGVIYTVYVNYDDEYVITSGTTFTTFSSSASADDYNKTTVAYSNGSAGGVIRLKADGTLDTSTTGNLINYWQAVRDTSTTPSDSSTDWHRIRVFGTYANSNAYYAYNDDRYNDYVVHNNILWKAKRTQASGGSQVAPSDANTDYWERGDLCGKRLNSCKCRFGFNPINSGTASSTGKATKDTELRLPYGGFPGARKFK